jgi:hypothetical protein
VRVLVESTDGEEVWGTIGVSPNIIIHASREAMVDAFEHKSVKDGVSAYRWAAFPTRVLPALRHVPARADRSTRLGAAPAS